MQLIGWHGDLPRPHEDRVHPHMVYILDDRVQATRVQACLVAYILSRGEYVST